MIIAWEPCWVGVAHASVNSAHLQILARALPGQPIRVLADASHIAELRRDPALTGRAELSFATAPVSPHFSFHTQIVSVRRFADEFAALRRVVRQVPRGEKLLLFLLSATPTALLAARLLAGLRRCCAVHVVLHGNLNDACGWRTRNPLLRRFDMSAMLTARQPSWLGFIVLEESILRELAARFPAAAAQTDVLTHAINRCGAEDAAPPPCPPLRVGFVGQATHAKGFDVFLALARELRARHGSAVEFDLVGRLPPSLLPPDTDFSPLLHPPLSQGLTREEYAERLARLHYVLLPYRDGYYTLSPSGALVDAATWLKPLIAMRTPTVADLFAQGDIGCLCDDQAGLRTALEAALREGTGPRYGARVAVLKQLRAERSPDVLAGRYAAIVRARFGRLFAP